MSQFKTGSVIRVNCEDVLWGCAWDGSNGITFTWIPVVYLWLVALQNTEIHIKILGLLIIVSEEVLLFILICSSSTRLSLLIEFRCRPLLSYVSPVVEPNTFVCLQMIIITGHVVSIIFLLFLFVLHKLPNVVGCCLWQLQNVIGSKTKTKNNDATH